MYKYITMNIKKKKNNYGISLCTIKKSTRVAYIEYIYKENVREM